MAAFSSLFNPGNYSDTNGDDLVQPLDVSCAQFTIEKEKALSEIKDLVFYTHESLDYKVTQCCHKFQQYIPICCQARSYLQGVTPTYGRLREGFFPDELHKN